MDMHDLKKRIIGLNEEIEDILRESGYLKSIGHGGDFADDDSLCIEITDVLHHLGYVNTVAEKWKMRDFG